MYLDEPSLPWRGSMLDAHSSQKLLANGVWYCDFGGVVFGLSCRRGITGGLIAKIGDADESYELSRACPIGEYARLARDFSAIVDVAG